NTSVVRDAETEGMPVLRLDVAEVEVVVGLTGLSFHRRSPLGCRLLHSPGSLEPRRQEPFDRVYRRTLQGKVVGSQALADPGQHYLRVVEPEPLAAATSNQLHTSLSANDDPRQPLTASQALQLVQLEAGQ